MVIYYVYRVGSSHWHQTERMSMMDYNKPKAKLTRGTKALIKDAIATVAPEYQDDRFKICEAICQMAEEKYQGNNLNYQLSRMDLTTTGKVLEKIDIYFYTHQN